MTLAPGARLGAYEIVSFIAAGGMGGKEILYLESNRIWSVKVDASGPQLRFETPEELFSVRPVGARTLDVSPLAVSRDGSRIYFPQSAEQPDSDVIHIRIGWDRGK